MTCSRPTVGACLLTLLLGATIAPVAFGQGRPPTPVRVDAARSEALQSMRQITGDIKAPRRSRLAGIESGRIETIDVREGQSIRLGDVIAELDARRLRLQKIQAEADKALAAATLAERQAGRDRMQRDLELINDAYERGGAQLREKLDAVAALAVADARIVQAERAIDAVQARIDILIERLVDTKILAPFDGMVISRHTEVGEWLAEGATVVELIALDPLEVWIDVPQRFLEPVRSTAAPVAIQIESTQQERTIDSGRIVPQVDPKARTFSMVLTVDNADRALLPGMSVVAWVPTGEPATYLTIAKNAVLRNSAGPYVYVVRDAGDGPPVATPVSVELLFPRGDRFAVRGQALRDGDRLVVEGNERLFPGSPVTPVDPAAQTPATDSPS